MKSTLEKTGHLNVEVQNPDNPDGSPAVDRWSITPAQVEPHLHGIDTKAHPFHRLSDGDKSAARDAAHEFRKQRDS